MPIDPVESVLAIVGVKAIVSKEVERFTMGDAYDAQMLTKRLYKAANAMLHGESDEIPKLGAFNYKKVLNDLTEDYDEAQLIEMVQKFPPQLHAITSQFLVKAQEVVSKLRQLFPVQKKQTLLGPENVLPSAMAIKRFATAFDVLDDPMRVLAHMANGSLLKSQATIVKDVYPSFSATLDDALEEAKVKLLAERAHPQLPPLVTIGWSAWANLPRVPVSLFKRLQDNFTQANADKSNAQPPAGSDNSPTSVAAKAALTPTQQSMFPATQKGR